MNGVFDPEGHDQTQKARAHLNSMLNSDSVLGEKGKALYLPSPMVSQLRNRTYTSLKEGLTVNQGEALGAGGVGPISPCGAGWAAAAAGGWAQLTP